ncbi:MULTISPECIES: BON domain-containing protein [unclassified Achromobacter]|uniref:BON domain-containing protein n=1 Tax=unclassified Achromobacter TaxID=2626865 RepID=UPI000B51DC8B|nr:MULTISPECIES: BON domain-containing protein [unclassified Achromobacter]OWT74692.1 ornithine aminotransferase [Achromobacter sp. HZ34]OWT79159.1 ornithine aminotransferase [Achromobacter sp. HZ28]
MGDRDLRRLVLDELDFDPSIDARNIGVAVKDSIVTLTGHITSFAEKYNAERAVQRVKGVRGLAQELEVRLSPSVQTEDDQLARRVVDMLAWDSTVPADKIQVKVQNAWVTLGGTVDWDYQRRSCESTVRRLAGIRGIVNDVKVREHVHTGDLRSSVDKALQRSAEIEAKGIRLQVLGGSVTLSGQVHSWHERNAVQQAVWAVPGVTAVVNQLAIS